MAIIILFCDWSDLPVLCARPVHLIGLYIYTSKKNSFYSSHMLWRISLTGLLTYLFLCRIFRYRRLKNTIRKYKNVPLDYHKAQDISLITSLYEMPYMMQLSVSFALFKTYGIPTISRLLAKTNQLARLEVAGRRAEDTGVLLAECFLHDLDSERARMGLARINYLHSLYRTSISNDDMLYTLSLFVLEPARWAERLEWRSLSNLEKEARHIFLKEIGERMGIESIPTTFAAFENWSTDYETKSMIYSEDNKICGEATLSFMILVYPKLMHGFLRKFFIALVDERLRLAMGFEEVPSWMKVFVKTVFNVRAFLLRHCTLPRIFPEYLGQNHGGTVNEHGRYNRPGYLFEPWYVKETPVNQWCPFIQKRPGSQYKSHGFTVSELGPEKFAGKGVDIMEKDAEKMKERAISQANY